MDPRHPAESDSNSAPVFSTAGAMPGRSEMGWHTAYPNPDALIPKPNVRPTPVHGPAFSIAGVMPAGPEMHGWHTAMVNPAAIEKGPTRAELYRRAQEIGLRGRSSMTKAQLQRALAA